MVTVRNLSHADSKTWQLVLVVIIYHPPGSYSELSECSKFIDNWSTEKIFIVGDFNIHVDKESDTLSSAFMSLID